MTDSQLIEAIAANHCAWFVRKAVAVERTAGVLCTDEGHGGTIAFPALPADTAGQTLDTILAWYCARSTQSIGCWSLDPPQPSDLGVRLLARGFRPGWQPCWMGLAREALVEHAAPAGVTITADDTTELGEHAPLPYASTWHGTEGVAQRFLARQNGEVVGQSAVLLDPIGGVAGLYNVGVVPTARNTGIGKALVVAACRYAWDHGFRYATLNATGRRMYEQVGFRWLGYGWTWWCDLEPLRAAPPDPVRIALAEALGRGDTAGWIVHGDLAQPLPGGRTLLQLTADCQQPAAARWLIAQGVPLDPLTAWDFGWHDEAAALLAADPSRVNQRYGEWNTTLLHLAAQRDDLALARLALAHQPDLTLTDTMANGTPLGWARHFQRTELIALLTASAPDP